MSAEILATELVAVKAGFHQWRLQSEDYSCESCNKNGCVWCLPKITMVCLLQLMLEMNQLNPNIYNAMTGGSTESSWDSHCAQCAEFQCSERYLFG
jgi:hypothetical protein